MGEDYLYNDGLIDVLVRPEHQGKLNSYQRIEPRSRKEDFQESLEMRTADPLWMLGRQWQFGEFQAEDNGTPISVEIEYHTNEIDQYAPANNFGFESLANKAPLEVIVECMSIPLKFDWRNRVRIGQQLERFIEKKSVVKALRKDDRFKFELPQKADFKKNKQGQYFPLDKKTERFIKRMEGKVIDGFKILETTKFGRTFNEIDTQTDGAIQKLQDWYNQLFAQEATKTSAWNKEKLQHKFRVSTHQEQNNANATTLVAPDYQSGDLDWYSFDKIERASIPKAIKKFPKSNEDITVVTSSISFGGMPKKRLFEMEDRRINFGNMKPGVVDLSRLMLMEFALVYSNDWFIAPLDLPMGSLCWIEMIEVKDTFGITTEIKRQADTVAHLSAKEMEVWDAFKIRSACELANRADDKLYESEKHFLFVPPVVPKRQTSKALETLLMMRDEHANMVWAIEETVTSGIGKPRKGFEAHIERKPTTPTTTKNKATTSPEDALPQYRLSTKVPDNWIPYLPVLGEDDQRFLKRAIMVRNEDAAEPEPINSISILANETTEVCMESVPRAGLQLQLERQRVRWIDGQTYVWMGREVSTGKGMGNSGLRFDYLKIRQ